MGNANDSKDINITATTATTDKSNNSVTPTTNVNNNLKGSNIQYKNDDDDNSKSISLLVSAFRAISQVDIVMKNEYDKKNDEEKAGPINPINLHEAFFQGAFFNLSDLQETKLMISVRMYSGDTFDINIAPSWLGIDLKRTIQSKTNVHQDQQKLIVLGKEIDDNTPLGEILERGSIVTVLLLARGGDLSKFLYLDCSFLVPNYDYDFTNINDDNETFYRGGEIYKRPCGYQRYALEVLTRYGGDSKWIGSSNSPGEWPVSYHGTSSDGVTGIAQVGYDESKGIRHKFGRGIYSTPDIKIAEKFAQKFEHEGKMYQVVLQNRVNPDDVIKIPPEDTCEGGEFWISKPTGVRAYGICIKQIN